jgi:hypothetical protein
MLVRVVLVVVMLVVVVLVVVVVWLLTYFRAAVMVGSCFPARTGSWASDRRSVTLRPG